MSELGQSDGGVVPGKSSNKPGRLAGAEGIEGRPPTQGKAVQHPIPRTQSRMKGMRARLERLRHAVRRVCWPKTSSVFIIAAKTSHLEARHVDLSMDEVFGQHKGEKQCRLLARRLSLPPIG